MSKAAACFLALNKHSRIRRRIGRRLRHPPRQAVERFFERQTEVLLLEALLELGPHRRRQLLGHHAHRRLERVPGADGAGQQVVRIRRPRLIFRYITGSDRPAAAATSATGSMREARNATRPSTRPAPRLIVTTAPGVVATPDWSISFVNDEPAFVLPTSRSTIGSALAFGSFFRTLVAPASSASSDVARSLMRCSN